MAEVLDSVHGVWRVWCLSAGLFATCSVLPSRALRFHQQVGVHFALTPALNPGMRMQRDVRPICCGGFFRFFPPGAVAQDCGSGMLPGPACAFGQQRLLGLELVGRLVCSMCLFFIYISHDVTIATCGRCVRQVRTKRLHNTGRCGSSVPVQVPSPARQCHEAGRTREGLNSMRQVICKGTPDAMKLTRPGSNGDQSKSMFSAAPAGRKARS